MLGEPKQHQLYFGWRLRILPQFDKNTQDAKVLRRKQGIIKQKIHLESLISRNWTIFLRSYITTLQDYHRRVDSTRMPIIGDIVLVLSSEFSSRHEFPLATITRIELGRDKFPRTLYVRVKKNGYFVEICRAYSNFTLLKISQDDVTES